MNFFEAYRQYTENTEPPPNFHAWTAISTISALLGKKCYIPQGFFTLHPNLYVVLTGPPGIKKSSAMNIGKDLLRSLDSFPLAPSSTTREALLQTLERNKIEYEYMNQELFYHQVSAFVTELEEFIGGKHINQAMIGVMTALWDEPTFEYITANKQPVVIRSPYFTLLGCCTDEWITSKLKSDVISGGFTRRVIFVKENDRNTFVPWPTKGQKEAKAWEVMTEKVQEMHQFVGKFRYTDDALAYWNNLYIKLQKSAEEQDPYIKNYFTTKHVLMLKVSMCLSAALRSDMIVDSRLLKLVERLFEITERNLLEVFQGMGRNELKQFQDSIVNFVQDQYEKTEKPVPSKDIMEQFSRDLSKLEYEESMQVLMQIEALEPQTNGAFLPKTRKKKETDQNLFDLILNYKPNMSEKCSDTAVSEIKRMVDPQTYRNMEHFNARYERLAKGILATKEQLKSKDSTQGGQ